MLLVFVKSFVRDVVTFVFEKNLDTCHPARQNKKMLVDGFVFFFRLPGVTARPPRLLFPRYVGGLHASRPAMCHDRDRSG